MEGCLFCELKADKAKVLFEDDICYAILDKYPIERGHLLVIPKEHVQDVLSAPDAVISSMFIMAARLGRLLKEKLGASGVQISTNIGESAGQLIMHAHVHVIPRYSGKAHSFGRRGMLTKNEESEVRRLLVGK